MWLYNLYHKHPWLAYNTPAGLGNAVDKIVDLIQ